MGSWVLNASVLIGDNFRLRASFEHIDVRDLDGIGVLDLEFDEVLCTELWSLLLIRRC